MRILIGWDSAEERETIESFLNIGDNSTGGFCDVAGLEAAYKQKTWDAVLLSLNFPSPEDAYGLFQRLRHANPDVPIIGAYSPGEIGRLAKFMLAGLHTHVLRDPTGEYIMLLTTVLEAAHQDHLAEPVGPLRRGRVVHRSL